MQLNSPRPASRFLFRKLSDIPEPPPREDIIEALATGGEIIALVGAPATGKSAVAVLAACCVAAGIPFLGRKVCQRSVVFIAAERQRETERRLKAGSHVDWPIFVSGARPALGTPIDVRELIAALKDIEVQSLHPIGLIVIDTAAKCFRDLDENSARDIGIAVEGLTKILEAVPTAVILLLHHLDKSRKTMRGSGALLAAVDVELTVKSKAAARWLEVTKANSVPEKQILPFRLQPYDLGGETIIKAEQAQAAGPPVQAQIKLPRDASTALKTLETMLSDRKRVSFEEWHEETIVAFGSRSVPTKRQAWSNAKRLLLREGLVVQDGPDVSVSKSSARRQRRSHADADEAVSVERQQTPPFKEGSGSADAPERVRAGAAGTATTAAKGATKYPRRGVGRRDDVRGDRTRY